MKRNQESEPAWLSWLRDQVRLTRDLEVLHQMLRQQGLSDDTIAAGIEVVRPRDSALAKGKLELPPLIRRGSPKLRKVDVKEFDLYTLEDFLSPKECERLITLTSHHLIPSPLPRDPGDPQYRNSTTCALGDLKSPVATDVDAKISRTIGIRPAYGEGIQVQRYDVGQQFKAHCDYFEPGHIDYLRFASISGNRTWTFMVYLNDGMEGGATRFVKANYAVKPKAGMAVLWNSLLEDGTPNPNTEHAGEPVTSGYKVIITKWFRIMGKGPVFYG